MFAGMHHVCLTVSDMEKSLEFYRDTLGLPVVREFELSGEELESMTTVPQARMKIVMLDAGGTIIELGEYLSPRGKPIPSDSRNCDVGRPHLCFLVKDIFKVYEDLTSKGVRFNAPPQVWPPGPAHGYKATYLQDPDGITLEILQEPAG